VRAVETCDGIRTGLLLTGDTLFYVNAGIGMSRVPVRFLCRPEFTLLTLVSEPESETQCACLVV
jgi:predicted MPP superfamily phosphohydrolase